MKVDDMIPANWKRDHPEKVKRIKKRAAKLKKAMDAAAKRYGRKLK